FFFQAEDGIRDFHVTGVQTCALPIWLRGLYPVAVVDRGDGLLADLLEPCAQRGGAAGDRVEAAQPHGVEVGRGGVGVDREQLREVGRAACREGVERHVAGGEVER